MNFIKESLTKHKELLLAVCLYLLLWGGLGIYTNAVRSGFHFQEDHVIIDMMQNIEQAGLAAATWTEVKGDLDARFRPLYIVYRYFCSYLFQLNFLCWHLILGIFLIGLMAFTFLIGRMLGLSFLVALSLPLIITSGSAVSAVIRLATSELMGAFFSAVAIYFILKSVTESSAKKRFELFAHIFVFLACCSKEAFILLIPVFVAIKLFADYNNNLRLREALKRNLSFIITEAILLMICMAVILLYFSKKTESIYAGFDGDIRKAAQLLWQTALSGMHPDELLTGNGIYVLLIALGFLILIVFRRTTQSAYRDKTLLFYTIIFLYLTTTQYLTHYKIEFDGHYLLPYLFGPALVICLLAELISKRLGRVAKLLSLSVILFLLLIKIAQSYEWLNVYSEEGHTNEQVVHILNNTSKKSYRLLISGDELLHTEHFESIPKYLNYFYPGEIQISIQLLPSDEKMFMRISGMKDSLLLPLYKAHNHKRFAKHLYTGSIPLQNFDAILIFSYCQERFLEINQANSMLLSFNKKSVGKDWYSYTIYKKAD